MVGFPARATSAISSTLAPSKPRFEKHLSGRVEDALPDLSGMLAGRAAATNHGARPFGDGVRFHRRFHPHRASFPKVAIAKICAHAS